jgi:hypothetical protein
MDSITNTILKTIENADIPKVYSSIHGSEPHATERVVLGNMHSSKEFITSQHEIHVPANLVVFTFTPLGCLAYSLHDTEAYDRDILFNGQKVEKRSGEQITIPWFLLGEFPLSKTAMVFYPGSTMPNTVHLFDKESSYFDLFSLNKDGTDDTLRDSRAPKAHALLQKLQDFPGFDKKIIKKMNIKNWSDLKAETYDQHYKRNPRKVALSPHTNSFGTFTTKYLLDYLSNLIPRGQLGVVYINACNPLSRITTDDNAAMQDYITTDDNTVLLDYTTHYVKSKERLEKEGRDKMKELQRLAATYYKATPTKFGTRIEIESDKTVRVPKIDRIDHWYEKTDTLLPPASIASLWKTSEQLPNGTINFRAGMEDDNIRDALRAKKMAYMPPEVRDLKGFSRIPPSPKKGGGKKSKRRKSRKYKKIKRKKTKKMRR